MRDLEGTVRAAVQDLAEEAPLAHDLAAMARVRGRRIRRRRQTLAGLAAVALLGAVVTPYALVHDRRGMTTTPVVSVAPTSAQPSATTEPPRFRTAGAKWWNKPVMLPGDLVVTSVSRRGNVEPAAETAEEGNVALDRSTGRYRIFPSRYQVFQAAPTGKYVLVESDGPVQVGIGDSTTGRARMLDHGSGGGVEWSSDGKTLLLTLNLGGFRLIDAATAERKDFRIPESDDLCPDFCYFTWLPGGREVALAQRDPSVEQSESRPDTVKSVKVYSANTGRLVREIPVPGVPAGSTAWSPDGRHVLLLPDASADDTRIAEVATGRVVGVIPGEPQQVYFAGSDTILAVEGTEVGLYDGTGNLDARIALPEDFAGREISIGRL